MEKLVLSANEAAAVMGISKPAIYALANREDFPAIRLGRKILIPADALAKWLENNAGKKILEGVR